MDFQQLHSLNESQTKIQPYLEKNSIHFVHKISMQSESVWSGIASDMIWSVILFYVGDPPTYGSQGYLASFSQEGTWFAHRIILKGLWVRSSIADNLVWSEVLGKIEMGQKIYWWRFWVKSKWVKKFADGYYCAWKIQNFYLTPHHYLCKIINHTSLPHMGSHAVEKISDGIPLSD